MLKRILYSFVVLSLLAAVPVMAEPIVVGSNITVTNLYESGGTHGGPFGLRVTPGDAVDDAVSFCIERGEYINYTDVFNVKNISLSATKNNDHISNGTAQLFLDWYRGVIVRNSTNNARVQNAIWFLEGEVDGIAWSDPTMYQDTSDYTGNEVRVLNLQKCNSPCIDAQDQLIVTPVPEPGSMSLLGMGLLFLANRARKWGVRQ